MRGERAIGILQNAISPGSDAASVDKSKKRLAVIETQLSSSLSPAQIYPTYFFCTGEALLLNGAIYAHNRAINTSSPLCAYWSIVSVADADNLDEHTISMPLAAGEYTLQYLYVKSGNQGKFDVYFDGVLISALLDTYAAGTTVNQLLSQTFTCASDGNHTLLFKANGKNAGSSDYAFTTHYIEIKANA